MVVLKLPREIDAIDFSLFSLQSGPRPCSSYTAGNLGTSTERLFAERLLEGSVSIYRWEEDMHIAYNCFN